MNRQALRNLVIEATGRTDKVDLINNALNLAVEEVSLARNWSDLQREGVAFTIGGSRSISLAPDLARLSEVRVVDGFNSWQMRLRPKEWVVRYYPNPEVSTHAKPIIGYIESKTLYLVPVPDTTYELRYTYYRTHPPLNSDTDELLIRGVDRAVVAYAIFWVMQTIEKTQEAVTWHQTYSVSLASAIKLDRDSAVHQSAAPWGVADYPILDPYHDPFAQRSW